MATRNLAVLAEEAFARRGDYEALLFEGRWHGSGELFSRATTLAGGLVELGTRPGERVVVSMANCPEVSVVYQAVWRLGCGAAPLAPQTAAELERRIPSVKLRQGYGADRDRGAHLDQLEDALLEHTAVVGAGVVGRRTSATARR